MSSVIFLETVNVMNICVLPNSYVGTLIPSVIILGVEAFERWLGHAGGVSWLMPLYKSSQEVVSHILPRGNTVQGLHLGKRALPDRDLRLPASRTVSSNFYLQVAQSVELCQNSSLNCLRQGIFEAQCYFLGIDPLEIISFVSAIREESGLPGFEFELHIYLLCDYISYFISLNFSSPIKSI